MTDTDARIIRELERLMEAAPTVEPHEALRRAAERRRSGWVVRQRLWRPREPIGVAVRAVLAGALVVAAVVLVLIARSGPRPGPIPAAPSLAGSVLVLNPCCGGPQPIVATVAVSAQSGEKVPLPNLPGGIEDYALTRAGSAIVAVRRTDRDTAGLTGPAYVFDVGSTRYVSLGSATDGYPGSLAGSVWLLTENSTTSHHVTTAESCNLRLVSASGALLVRPAVIPCSWDVWGGVRQGVVVSESPDTFKVWTPPGWAPSHVSFIGNQPWLVLTGGSTIALVDYEEICPCELTLVDSATGVVTTVSLAPPRSESMIERSTALSPDGRLLAFVSVPETLPDQPTFPTGISCGGCLPVVHPVQVTGNVTVVTASTGKVVVSRPVPLLVSGSDVETVPTAWSADSAFLFLPSSLDTIEAVPAFSAAAALHDTRIPVVLADQGYFSDDLLAALSSSRG